MFHPLFNLQSDGDADVPDNPLTPVLVQSGLSTVAPDASGAGHSYVRLELHGRRLTEINLLTNYTSLQFVDLAHNRIASTKPLSSLKHILVLNMMNNKSVRRRGCAVNRWPVM